MLARGFTGEFHTRREFHFGGRELLFLCGWSALFITLPAGVYLERMNKRYVVIALQAVMMVQAFYLGILTLTGQVTIWHILALSFVLGLASAVEEFSAA